MNDEQLIWERYQNRQYPMIKMISISNLIFSEKDQETEKINQLKKLYGTDYNDIEWDEQPKPIVSIDEDGDMTIEDGHHRIAAFKQLGYPEVPVILVIKKDFDSLKNKYGLKKASIIVADQIGDYITSSHLMN